MENYSVPDFSAAERHMENAKTSLLEAVRSLRNPDQAAGLTSLAATFGKMALEFKNRRLLGGFNVPLLDKKMAAQVMGRDAGIKKLAGAAKAREGRARKRAVAKERRGILMKVAKHTMGLPR